ncbi:B12-binding domain-containing protein [Conexibacter sp. SYSU D00693]|uniref:cobalamin B12-binding domain-containing protein n=1 Tax=Conexibacter sp. SYSU D00693 TaxID=2812560 RepID=UPI00196A6631|nr:B12-binding domain-containing protein [Conexibacter sp. SYSU D00693]
MHAEPQGALDGLLEGYVDALLTPDPALARALVVDACSAGVPAQRLYLEVLAPAMEEVGRRWEQARISVAQEHLATQVTQTVLATLVGRLEEDGDVAADRGTAVVAGTPGELHALGLSMVRDFLEVDGWTVHCLGPDCPTGALVELVERQAPDVVALSTALPQHLLAAGAVFAALRRLPAPPLLVAGGRAYAGDEARARAVGADLLAADPRALVLELRARAAAR